MFNVFKFFNQKKSEIILDEYLGEYKANDGRTGKLYSDGNKIKFTYDGKTISFMPSDKKDVFTITYFPFKGLASFIRNSKGIINGVKADMAGYVIDANKIA